MSLEINYYDNRNWFPGRLEEERLACLEDEPDLYPHIWLGKPDDIGKGKLVLPFRLVEGCVDAYKRGLYGSIAGIPEAGLDVSDSGDNYNSMTMRRGPVITWNDKWYSQIIGDTAREADRLARENGLYVIYFDAGGPGGGVRSYFAEFTGRNYAVRPEFFGGKVEGAGAGVHVRRYQ